MRALRCIFLGLLLAGFAQAAFAAGAFVTRTVQDGTGTHLTQQYDVSGTGAGPFINATSDAQSAPFSTAVPLTVGAAPVAAGRSVGIYATAAGTVTFTMAGGGSYTVPVTVGYQLLPFAVTGVSAATATATYANLN